jgi:RluA family pseudouridine synthase
MSPLPGIRRLRVSPGAARQTLQGFLASQSGVSRRRAKALLDSRTVFVNGARVWMAQHALQPGDTVEFPAQAPAAPAAGARRAAPAVLYDEGGVLVIDKPPGLLSTGPRSAERRMQDLRGKPELRAVHRLDRDTSGCLMLAESAAAAEPLIEQFRRRAVRKVYHALAIGAMERGDRTLRGDIDGEPAVTHARVLDSRGGYSHLRVAIDTGRTHQIRRHLSGIGRPVLGDRVYGAGRAIEDERAQRVPRQMLHSSVLQWKHPVSGATVRVEAPLPADFLACMRLFKLS